MKYINMCLPIIVFLIEVVKAGVRQYIYIIFRNLDVYFKEEVSPQITTMIGRSRKPF
jgi:hypothetical protein